MASKKSVAHPVCFLAFCLLAFGGAGIVAGLAMFGYRVMRLVGTKITAITPSRGVAAGEVYQNTMPSLGGAQGFVARYPLACVRGEGWGSDSRCARGPRQ